MRLNVREPDGTNVVADHSARGIRDGDPAPLPGSRLPVRLQADEVPLDHVPDRRSARTGWIDRDRVNGAAGDDIRSAGRPATDRVVAASDLDSEVAYAQRARVGGHADPVAGDGVVVRLDVDRGRPAVAGVAPDREPG